MRCGGRGHAWLSTGSNNPVELTAHSAGFVVSLALLPVGRSSPGALDLKTKMHYHSILQFYVRLTFL
jgi:hypothetical protein